MTPDERRRIIEVCDTIIADTEADVLRYEGMPFNGKTIAEITGEQNAMIAGLAAMVKALAEDTAEHSGGTVTYGDGQPIPHDAPPEVHAQAMAEGWREVTP